MKYNNNNRHDVPQEIKKKLFDKDQQCLFGSTMVKASPYYEYIDGEHTETGNELLICSGVNFDGGKESDSAPKKDKVVWKDLPERFPDNEFN